MAAGVMMMRNGIVIFVIRGIMQIIVVGFTVRSAWIIFSVNLIVDHTSSHPSECA
jgi:uncharacterized membrane protein